MRQRQTKLESLLEAVVNIAFGFLLSWLTWIFIIPIFFEGVGGNASQGFWITVVFTVVSLARMYVWRRLFEHEIHKNIHRMIVNCCFRGFFAKVTNWENY